jgi:hypothetical protein
VLGVVGVLILAGPVFASGVVGDGTPGSCTEDALDAALAGGGSVTFDCGPNPVTLTVASTKTISADTAMKGGGLVTVSGEGTVALFSVNSGVAFTVQDVTIADGKGSLPAAGGITNFGTVTVTNGTFTGNSADADGGGISNFGTLTVTNSTFSNNAVPRQGAGILNYGTLTVINSTFTGNSADRGGGIWSDNYAPGTIINSTFANNGRKEGGDGGGIYNDTGHSLS